MMRNVCVRPSFEVSRVTGGGIRFVPTSITIAPTLILIHERCEKCLTRKNLRGAASSHFLMRGKHRRVGFYENE